MERNILGRKVIFEEPTYEEIRTYTSELQKLVSDNKQMSDVHELQLNKVIKLSKGVLSPEDIPKLRTSDLKSLLSVFEELFDYTVKKK